MKDTQERLEGLFRSMPRERASDGFTREVMDMAASREAGRAPGSRRRQAPLFALAAAAAVLALALGIAVSMVLSERSRRSELRQEISALRREHQRLDNEVSRLRDRSTQQVIYLGGDDTVDYVLDLERLARRRLGDRAMPAVLETALEIRGEAWPEPVLYSGGAL